MTKISLIVAHDSERGIGKDGMIPWDYPEDLKYFKRVTVGTEKIPNNAVIMGRKTWESLPLKYRPLKDRLNIVLSRNEMYDIPAGVVHNKSLKEAIKHCETENINEAFIIGGASLYKESLEKNLCDKLYITKISYDFFCDTFFPKIDESLWTKYLIDDDNIENPIDYYEYVPYNKEENQYLDLIKDVLDNGTLKSNRTGTDTLSLFGRSMRFSLKNGRMPLLTTKRTFWRGLAEELLWFINGSTNANLLAEKGVHIWDGNGSREFLDSRGLGHLEVGDLGACYGFQWRHFGATYKTMHDDYSGKGKDQFDELIKTLKTDPGSRRMIISAWNPAALHEMSLPPCHLLCQFYVTPVEDGPDELSCQMYQRSCDIGLGVPFNIASYALLTHMIAKCVGMVAGEFIHVLGDAHIYVNHIDALKEQIKRTPRLFPTLKINTDNKDGIENSSKSEGFLNIDGFKYEDFEIVGYNPYKSVKMDMVV
jgi:dihydrofolate reductase/thymidylate synthase